MIMNLVALPRNRAIEIGSKTYVDPWACKRGHFTHKLVSRRVCYECSSSASRNHMRRKYADPDYREVMLAKRKEKYHRDDDYRKKISDAHKRYYEENAEEVRARVKRYAKNNPEKLRSSYLRYYEENRESLIEYQKYYREANPEKVSAWFATSRARRRERFIDLTDDLEELNQLCMEEAYHSAKERSEMFGFDWHVDHMVPLQADEASGLHIYSNIQVIPAHLNQFKHKKMIYTEDLEWLADATSEE